MSYNYEKSIWGTKKATLFFSDPTNIRLRRLLKNLTHLPEGAKVLEVGSGAGSFIRAVKDFYPNLNCFGVDLSERAIEKANSFKEDVTFSICDDNNLPFSDNVFDFIFFTDVLEHVNNPIKFIKEIKRILKKDGLLFFFIPCEKDIFSLWKYLDLMGLKKNLTKKFAGHINFFTRKEIFKLISKADFNILQKTYSEHFLGQLLGIISFNLFNRHYKKTGKLLNNEQYFFEKNDFSFFVVFKKIINTLISLESIIFYKIPSQNMFVLAKKR